MKSHGKKANSDYIVLIVEDSPTQAAELKYLLGSRSYKTVIASNGIEALKILPELKPSIIISDIIMPEMDGYELCKKIKSDDELKNIPVILLTSLSEAKDIVKALQCGADNFIRKPYDEKYLLSRINYVLTNIDLRRSEKVQFGMEIYLGGERHFINSERQQILDLLISTYEQAVQINGKLKHSYLTLDGLYNIAKGLNKCTSEQAVIENALEEGMQLPGIKAGWILLKVDNSKLKLAGVRGMPQYNNNPEFFEGECRCWNKLLSGELDKVTVLECERLQRVNADKQGISYHASVPLWSGDQVLGIMNLLGSDEGMFSDEELETFFAIGNQIGTALERARLFENLENLVEEKTAALFETEIWFSTVFNSQQDAIFVVSPDRRVINMNNAAEKLFGYTLNEVKGKSTEIFHVDHEHFETFGERIFESFEKEEPARFEFQLKNKEEEIFYSDHTVSFINDKSGKLTGIVSVVRDITERKRAEENIRKLNRVYAVLSNVNQAIVRIHDRQKLFDEICKIAVEDGKFKMAWIGLLDENSRSVKKVVHNGIVGTYFNNLNMNMNDGSAEINPLAIAINTKKQFVINDIELDDLMQIWREKAIKNNYRSFCVLPLIVFGKAYGVVNFYSDKEHFFDEEELKLLEELTMDVSFAIETIYKEEERKKAVEEMITAKEKAEEMNKIKSYFFANMSHELRTPFVGILGFAEILAETLTDPDSLKMVNLILESSRRLTDTLNKILSLSKLEFEEITLQLSDVNINEIIEECHKLFINTAAQKNVILIKNISKDPCIIKSDERMLREVLMSLLHNAIKYTNKGQIEVSSGNEQRTDGEYLILKISDTGIGIPQEMHDMIWREFRQVSEGHNRSFEGTGLGLTIAKKYTELLGGKISVQSEPDKGSVFTVEIPAQGTELQGSALVQIEQIKYTKPDKGKLSKVSNKTILYVEDDRTARDVISRALKGNYDIDMVESAEKALDAVNSKIYDALLIDINLSYGIDGLRLMELIRQMPIYKNTPIAAVTAYAAESDKEEFLAKGFTHYISKPFMLKELLSMMEQIFEDE